MIKNIKLVSQFALKDKSHINSNVLVKNGKMIAQNDYCGISIDVDSDIDFCCNAQRLNQVLNNCDAGKLKINIKNERLYISSGRFKSNIELIPIDNYFYPNSDEESINIQSDIINQLNILSQFTEPDDVRLAMRGVAITNGSLKATNGHMLIKKDIDPIDIDEVIIPTKSINLLSKVNAFIDSISINESSVFFYFNDGFLFSKSIDAKMPDLDRVIPDFNDPIKIEPLIDPIKSIAPLCEGLSKVVVLGDCIKTQDGSTSFDGFNIKESAFNADYLLKIINVADEIDFSNYPNPCPFRSDGIIGAIAGIKI